MTAARRYATVGGAEESARDCCTEGRRRSGMFKLMRRIRRVRPVLPPPSAFTGFRFPWEVIVLAVRWYVRYGLSYRDVEELLAERGVRVDHVAICECRCGAPGWRTTRLVLVTRRDSVTIWPLRRALRVDLSVGLPAPAWPTSWPD
jgi:hypothetical protein